MSEYKYPYQNPELSPEERAKDLLSRLNTKEKVMQMTLRRRVDKDFDPVKFDEEYPYSLGSSYHTEDLDVDDINRMQEHALHHTKWGIPLYLMGESLHGFMCDGATVFPAPIGLGASFDEKLYHDMAKTIGKEVRSMGVHETYAPNLDLSREPRWGRCEENPGEDPYLTSRYAYQYITGIQSQGVASSPKHYLAHGTPESGINIGPVHAGEREVRETMLRPFKAAFTDAKAMSVMPAYSELDGVPIHASHYWMTDVLRDELGFEGWAVSDWGAIHRLQTDHHLADNVDDIGLMALHAGVDMEAPNTYGFGDNLVEEAEKDPKVMEEVNLATYRLLLGKFKLGLFENPYAVKGAPKHFRSKTAMALVKQAGLESCVLLKNDGILPLDPKKKQTVALIGPGAKNTQMGGYTSEQASAQAITLYDALKSRLGKKLIYAQGSSIAFTNPQTLQEAYDAAMKADIVVLALSGNSMYYANRHWGDDNHFTKDQKATVTCGEGFDVDSLAYPDAQLKLFRKVLTAKKPIIIMAQSGRPQLYTDIEPKVHAIFHCFCPGEFGGEVMAELLYGEESPSAHLPITFPRSDGQLPCYYNYKTSKARKRKAAGSKKVPGRTYVFNDYLPLYPFGYGLTYTTFTYSNLKVKKVGEMEYEATVTVQNTGDREGTDVVMMFLTDSWCRITPFVKQLRGFKRVLLQPGEKKRVKFPIGFEDLSFVNEKMEREVEPGEFVVQVGEEKVAFNV